MKIKSIITAAALIAAMSVAQAQAGDVDYKAAANKYTADNHLTFESGEIVNGVYTFKAKDAAGVEQSYTIDAAGVVAKVAAPAPVTPAAPAAPTAAPTE